MARSAKRQNGVAAQGPAVAYIRVSSKEQAEGFSLDAQQKLLREYAAVNGLTISREFTDVETAKQAGRAAFNEMLAFLKRSACRVILVEKTDRLYRNIKDWVTLEELDLEVHLVKEGGILTRDSKSHEKLVHGFKVLMAKNYIDNLSEEVQKGMTEKAEQGHWPSWAPIGYRNNPDTHRIEPNPDEAPIIRKLFEEAIEGKTLVALSEAAHQRGLRSRRAGSPIAREGITRLIKNSIYWGPFLWNGILYQGAHEPLVTKEIFDAANATRSSRAKPRRTKNSFAFAGMVTCSCGKRLVGQIAKRRYIYYACSARCGTSAIKEKDLSAMFLEHLKAIRISEATAELILTGIKEFESKRRTEHAEQVRKLHARQVEIQRKVDAAYDDKLAGKITDEYWLQRSNQWQLDLATANAAIRELENATFDSFATGRTILELSQRAADLYVKQTWTEQARLIGLTHTNSRWDGATLTPAYRKPFDLLAEGLQGVTGGPDGVFTQTFALWIQQPYAVNRRISISAPLVTACSARTSTCSLMI